MTYDLTPDDYLQLAEDSRRRTATIKPDTPMNCYDIEACRVFEDTMHELAAGRGTFEALIAEMFRRQKALTVQFGVNP